MNTLIRRALTQGKSWYKSRGPSIERWSAVTANLVQIVGFMLTFRR